MADNTKAVTITTSATEIVPYNRNRRIMVIRNNGTVTVYLGFSTTDCTTATGFPLEAGDVIKYTLKVDPIYGIVASGTCDVRVEEQD